MTDVFNILQFSDKNESTPSSEIINMLEKWNVVGNDLLKNYITLECMGEPRIFRI